MAVRIRKRELEAKEAIRNENLIRRAMNKMWRRNLVACFHSWVDETARMQKFKVRFMMKWRRREIAYFFASSEICPR